MIITHMIFIFRKLGTANVMPTTEKYYSFPYSQDIL